MEIFLAVIGVLAALSLLALATYRLCRNSPLVTVWGKVRAKIVGPYGDGLQRIVVEVASRSKIEIKTLSFDSEACDTCLHEDGSQCFHGKGKELDKIIRSGHSIVVKVFRNGSDPGKVHQLVAPKLESTFIGNSPH